MLKKYFELTYQQLLIYGIHLGHTFANSIMYAAWLVYTYKDNLLIMNIFKTFYVMKVGFRRFNAAVYFRAPIWFVNLDKSAGWFSKSAAYSCGEASWTTKWANGVLVNYLRFDEVYRWLMQTSSEWAYKAKNRWVNDYYFDWRLTRQSWPRVILVSSVHYSKAPVREALYLGIPCVGIVDTNVNSNKVTVAVPGNDESLECLAFYSDVVANYVLIKKFALINQWFIYRKPSRLVTFNKWLRNKYTKTFTCSDNKVRGMNKLHISHIYPTFNIEKNVICSISLLFGRNDRFKTPRYSFLDVSEYLMDNTLDYKRKPKELAINLQSRAWWWTFLGQISSLKTMYKIYPPFRRRIRSRRIRKFMIQKGGRRRKMRGRLRWIVIITFVDSIWNIHFINGSI